MSEELSFEERRRRFFAHLEERYGPDPVEMVKFRASPKLAAAIRANPGMSVRIVWQEADNITVVDTPRRNAAGDSLELVREAERGRPTSGSIERGLNR